MAGNKRACRERQANRITEFARGLKSKTGPVHVEDDTAKGAGEYNQDDNAAANACAGTTLPKTEPAFQPVKERLQEEELNQSTQTATPLVHTFL
jgi:hypothetical protein